MIKESRYSGLIKKATGKRVLLITKGIALEKEMSEIHRGIIIKAKEVRILNNGERRPLALIEELKKEYDLTIVEK